MKFSIFMLVIVASSCMLETHATIGELFKLKAKLFSDDDDGPKQQPPIVVHVHKSDAGNNGGGNGGGSSAGKSKFLTLIES
jgi:hypothetical protein